VGPVGDPVVIAGVLPQGLDWYEMTQSFVKEPEVLLVYYVVLYSYLL
jgi:hypothetical protein